MKSALPTISLVTPSFNQGRYLRAALESVLSQAYDQLEYVVIDGGSTDESVDIIREHQSALAHWVSEPDRGHADALNKGFARTSGEIMGWLNSSDLHYPWTLRTVAEVFRDVPEAQWLIGVPTQWTEDSRGPKSIHQAYWNLYDLLGPLGGWIQQESVFWRRQLWDATGAHIDATLRYAGDYDLWLRFMAVSPLFHVETAIGGFRVHGERLGGAGYGWEARQVQCRSKAAVTRTELARARLAEVLTWQGSQALRHVLGRLPWPTWYAHPRIVYDFGGGRWIIR